MVTRPGSPGGCTRTSFEVIAGVEGKISFPFSSRTMRVVETVASSHDVKELVIVSLPFSIF
jgi:hypothetical protein